MPMLKLRHIKKYFAGVKALEDVNLEVTSGEIHALLGENGAGKSTLMKVISGAHLADEGEIIFENKPLLKTSPSISKSLGISIIYQEFSLVEDLSVAENIYLGKGSSMKWLNWNHINKSAEVLLHSLGFQINVRQKVAKLSIAEQQIVEIAKALSSDVKLLILDEPSAVLGTAELAKLFVLLRSLRDRGVAIIYISHHLDELLELTDRITVLKDGRSVETVFTKDISKDDLVTLMIGRSISQMYPQKRYTALDGKQIQINNLQTVMSVEPISLILNKGEILGIGGLVGAGRTEILDSLFGNYNNRAEIIVDNKKMVLRHPKGMIEGGWGMVPEDRKRLGGILPMSIKENISLTNLGKISNRWGFINLRKEKEIVLQLIQKLQIKIGSMDDPLASLSGGNQQKVILAKWLNVAPQVLLVDEPTRGVDVGARAEIYTIIQELADQGVYILMVSSDMDELMGLSDRIVIVRKGQLIGELQKSDFSEEIILRMALGAN